jgi:hypothetical protein
VTLPYWFPTGFSEPIKRMRSTKLHAPRNLPAARTLRCATIIALFMASLLVVACSGSDSSKASAAGNSSGSSDAQDTARVRLTDCLRKQGIDVPSNPGQGGGGGPRNIDRDKLRQAMQGPCKKYQQKAFGNVSQQDRAEFRDRLTKFTSCMRKNGVDIPDFGAQGGGQQPAQIDQSDPAVQKATKACRDKLPRGGPGGGAGPGQ